MLRVSMTNAGFRDASKERNSPSGLHALMSAKFNDVPTAFALASKHARRTATESRYGPFKLVVDMRVKRRFVQTRAGGVRSKMAALLTNSRRATKLSFQSFANELDNIAVLLNTSRV